MNPEVVITPSCPPWTVPGTASGLFSSGSSLGQVPPPGTSLAPLRLEAKPDTLPASQVLPLWALPGVSTPSLSGSPASTPISLLEVGSKSCRAEEWAPKRPGVLCFGPHLNRRAVLAALPCPPLWVALGLSTPTIPA